MKINRNTCDGKMRERGATLSGDLARIFSDRIAHPRSSLGYLFCVRQGFRFGLVLEWTMPGHGAVT